MRKVAGREIRTMSYKKILQAFGQKRILVIGDLILDRYIWGKVDRISQEAPVPVVEVLEENYLLGGASNVAHNVVSLGGQATILGVTGRDRAGEIMCSMLEAKGVQCGTVLSGTRPTTIKTRLIAHNQQVVRFDREERDKIEGKVLGVLLDAIKREVHHHDAVIISDYRKGVISTTVVREILKHARQRKVYVAVDPKVGHFHCYKKVSIITPNVMEASSASGIEIKDEKTLAKAGRLLLKKFSCGAVLITRGEHGMSLFEKEAVVHIPTSAKNVYDVTGAGDTVIAAFTLAHVSGAGLKDAAIIANHAAGIVVGQIGTAVVSPADLARSMGLKPVTSKK